MTAPVAVTRAHERTVDRDELLLALGQDLGTLRARRLAGGFALGALGATRLAERVAVQPAVGVEVRAEVDVALGRSADTVGTERAELLLLGVSEAQDAVAGLPFRLALGGASVEARALLGRRSRADLSARPVLQRPDGLGVVRVAEGSVLELLAEALVLVAGGLTDRPDGLAQRLALCTVGLRALATRAALATPVAPAHPLAAAPAGAIGPDLVTRRGQPGALVGRQEGVDVGGDGPEVGGRRVAFGEGVELGALVGGEVEAVGDAVEAGVEAAAGGLRLSGGGEPEAEEEGRAGAARQAEESVHGAGRMGDDPDGGVPAWTDSTAPALRFARATAEAAEAPELCDNSATNDASAARPRRAFGVSTRHRRLGVPAPGRTGGTPLRARRPGSDAGGRSCASAPRWARYAELGTRPYSQPSARYHATVSAHPSSSPTVGR